MEELWVVVSVAVEAIIESVEIIGHDTLSSKRLVRTPN